MDNAFLEYHALVAEKPQYFSKEIRQLVQKQKDMLARDRYDFLPEQGAHVVGWIERFCQLVEGENAGQPVRLLLWQKWLIYSIFGFWGWFEEPEYDEHMAYAGTKRKYLRVVKDVLIVVASGNAKTTFMGFINTYLLYSKRYPAAKIYIGSNAQKQSRLCYDTTYEIIRRSKALDAHAQKIQSRHEIRIPAQNSLLMAMSSDGKNYEGIIPTNIMIDEIHAMYTDKYANDLRKSAKRDDSFIFETSTMGDVRGGYMDTRLDYAKKVLDGDVNNDRFLPCIFKQDSEDEVLEAYHREDWRVLMKSNPSMNAAVSQTELKNKIETMQNDPSVRKAILMKNFNLPQTAVNCFFSEAECRAKPFDESIFHGAPVFFGLDMAYTRQPANDLACLTMLAVDEQTGFEYYKDFYFLPKYWDKQEMDGDNLKTTRLDMVKVKSKHDTNIIYDPKKKRYGYQLYADRGDVVILDEAHEAAIRALWGDQTAVDKTGVTQTYILQFLGLLQRQIKFHLCKFGLDPNKANEIEATINAKIGSRDGLPPAIKFQMERTNISNPVLEALKDARARGVVHCNNKLTELHFANAVIKSKENGTFVLTNSDRAKKDGVIAHAAAKSAYNVFTTNRESGDANKQKLVKYWRGKHGQTG